MKKICTDINQSKKLIELGIDVSTADMFWDLLDGDEPDEKVPICYPERFDIYSEEFVPAWSLPALLELMPRSICIRETEFSGYFYFLEWWFANDNSLRYVGHNGKCLIDIYSDHDVKWKDSIDAAFEMVVWLKENGKI